MSSNKRISLVIGSGGIKCAAAVGLWRVLQSENIEIDSVVGCSGGSMYAATIANHIDVNVIEEWSRNLWTSDIMHGYTENLKATKDGSLRFKEKSGLVDDSVINKKLRDLFGEWYFFRLEDAVQSCGDRPVGGGEGYSFRR